MILIQCKSKNILKNDWWIWSPIITSKNASITLFIGNIICFFCVACIVWQILSLSLFIFGKHFFHTFKLLFFYSKDWIETLRQMFTLIYVMRTQNGDNLNIIFQSYCPFLPPLSFSDKALAGDACAPRSTSFYFTKYVLLFFYCDSLIYSGKIAIEAKLNYKNITY